MIVWIQDIEISIKSFLLLNEASLFYSSILLESASAILLTNPKSKTYFKFLQPPTNQPTTNQPPLTPRPTTQKR